jgi:endonuclease/exonuclease/phosphatase family metal-dependent hydrolase
MQSCLYQKQPAKTRFRGSERGISGWLLYVLLTLPVMPVLPAFAQTQSDSKPLTVMSYNIRYGTAQDGENHWRNRKESLIELIRHYDPDLLGTQETLAFQGDYLSQQLPHLKGFGVGRDDGQREGEMALLFFRKERFEKLDGGHFWLSDSPGKIGSKSWDSALPRIVSWVVLKDLACPGHPEMLFLNTHFDHRGQQARLESSRLIRKFVGDYLDKSSKQLEIILVGDFNAAENSPPYLELLNQPDSTGRKLVDSFRAIHPEKSPDEGTFSEFKVHNTRGARIDWILLSENWTIRSAKIDRTATAGRTPSDHFPVVSQIEWGNSNEAFRKE